MLTIAPGWELEVERGPELVLVRLSDSPTEMTDAPCLADQLWAVLQQHSTYRLVLDLNPVDDLDDYLLGELLQVYHLIRAHGGMMRLCSDSPQHRRALKNRGLDDRFVLYRDCEEAVSGGWRPHRPR